MPDVLETEPHRGGRRAAGGPLVEALLTVLVQCDVTDDSYWLLMEAAAALTVCMSTQMYARSRRPRRSRSSWRR